MADIFREIDEDVRRDRAIDFWKRHGNLIIGLALLAVLATAGWKAYEAWQITKAEAAGAQFEDALRLAKDGKADEAEKAFADIARDAPAGYRSLARFREAAELAKTDREKGLQAYQGLAADASLSANLRDVARLRSGLLLVDTASPADLKAALDPLLAAGNVFAANAKELLGLAALKAGDYPGAGKYFDEIVTDRQAPPSLKQRADLLLAIVRAGPVKPAS
jgi:hypothetical protein